MTNDAKLKFIAALAKAYGAQDALSAAKAAGINVAAAINEGLNSGNEGSRTAAQGLVNTIKSELESKNIQIPVNASVDVLVNATVQVTAQTTQKVGAPTIDTVKVKGKPVIKGHPIAYASGAYDIPRGDVFIANEKSAELVGSINGKTTVANQGQIIEGIQMGVYAANAEQNQLLREQNNLLRGILQKDNTVRFGASVALGRVASQSLEMYGNAVGG
jgi:hypothetical protein